MRLTPRKSQLEVESSSPESLAPATPVRKDRGVTARATCNIHAPDNVQKISIFNFGDHMPDDLDDRLGCAIDSACPSEVPTTLGSPWMCKDGDEEEVRTLNGQLLNSTVKEDGDEEEEEGAVSSAEFKLRPSCTLEPDLDIAMAVLNGEPLSRMQERRGELVANETTKRTNMSRQNDQTAAAIKAKIEVPVEGDDPYKAPPSTQLDTRLRSELTSFILLAPNKPGSSRGELMTSSNSASLISIGDADPRSVGHVASPTMVDIACQAELIPWPCATLDCKRRSEQSLTGGHCLGHIQRFEVLEMPHMSHSSTCVHPSGSPLCWECRLEHHMQVVKARKRRERARRRRLRLELPACKIGTDLQAKDTNKRRTLDADVSCEDLVLPAKRLAIESALQSSGLHAQFDEPSLPRGMDDDEEVDILADQLDGRSSLHCDALQQGNAKPLNAEASPRALLLMTPTTCQVVQAGKTRPEPHERAAQQTGSKIGRPETYATAAQVEDELKWSQHVAASCSTPHTPSSALASSSPLSLCDVRNLGSTPPISPPPPSSPRAGRESSASTIASTLRPTRSPYTIGRPSSTKLSTSPIATSSQLLDESMRGLASAIVNAFKYRRAGQAKHTPVHLHFCDCGRNLLCSAQKMPCRACMNEQYRDNSENRLAEEPDQKASSDDLCHSCRKLVAFDGYGLCIPCANPMVAGDRRAGNKQALKRKRCHTDEGGVAPRVGKDVVADMESIAKTDRKPLKSILKKR